MTTPTRTPGPTRPHPAAPPAGTRWRDTARGLAALAGLLLVLLGVPVALVLLGRVVPVTIPAGDPLSLLTRPDDGSLLLLVLLVVAWAAWAAFAASALLEVVALVRGVPTPRLPGLRSTQRGVGALVATAAVLLPAPIPTQPSGPATVRPVATQTHQTSPTTQPPPRPASTDPPRTTRPTQHPEVGASAVPGTDPIGYPTVTVARHDTLWGLAEKHLGAGQRYRDIVALNLGRPQPDGRSLQAAGWIYPGWVLRLPRDARHATSPGAAITPAAGAGERTTTYRVRPGDTLWDIADDQLGDPTRAGEIDRLNHGRSQPDGRTLTDPDLIRPGWQFLLPAPDGGPATVATPPEPLPPAAPVTPAPAPPPVPLPSDAPAGDLPTPAAPSTAPTAVTPPDQASPGDPTLGGSEGRAGEAALLATLVLGLGAVTLTGLVAELRRRRRRQQSVRRAGQRLPMPDPEPAAAEALAAASSTPVTVETTRAALRAMAAHCATTGRDLPDVTLVTLGPHTLDLTLHDPESNTAAVPPFTAVTPDRWRLTDQVDPDATGEAVDPYPVLVTLGATSDGLVLLNLESVGTLAITGDDEEQLAGVFRALAVDLAVGPLSGTALLTFAGCHADLAKTLDPARARYVDSRARAEREIDARIQAGARLLADVHGDLRRARSSTPGTDGTVPDVVLTTDSLDHWPPPWSGVTCLAATHDFDRIGAILHLGPDTATLHPHGVSLDPQQLDATTFEQLLSLLTVADAEPADAVTPDEDDPEATRPAGLAPAVAAALHALPSSSAPDDGPDQSDIDATPGAPRVLLLGPPLIDGTTADPATHRRRRLTELIAYLVLHPDATGPQIDEALWGGRRVEVRTRNDLISRARQWLGRAPDGDPYLPLITGAQVYRLRGEVSCDWHDFLTLAQSARHDPHSAATSLEQALKLVRGRPFLGINPATYTWAEADIQEMISSIVDVAHALATIRLTAGDSRGALEAGATGLLVDQWSEQLLDDCQAAAEAAGNLVELDHWRQRRLAAADALG